ncbi:MULTISPECIES: OmpA family protein [unclassified Tolypothrix]|uniref:OmpA family protein n=1 Tax=unclassified Tolypothrix TaxID=2649714 RepID=UPI0005EAB567|nr:MULTISPECIES: OmpA family protein [unclassified Tolypothrix]BAY89232.1 OmpA/MotB domain-containing protein [Microchaete diplosiphon NIES-3275]EKE97858.1 OmpA family protein [Tolypothrix sp. PCC 7601]MBE9082233.1 OmpA family protein [Tolypothrix sp. LEGE 11397]UYD23523.1 OmpA family protein [Tolypothrix sp. PCC 7712]UYD34249.1 OmpA family protein [Tolypothrix sp. PCC 7601]
MSNKSTDEIAKESLKTLSNGSQISIAINPAIALKEPQSSISENDSANSYTHTVAINSPVNNHHLQNNDELNILRSLLLGVEPTALNKLYERLENPQIQAEDISRLLPEAVVLRSKQDKQLGEAIVTTVETALQNSIQQDQNRLSETFFPIIGPATRKAISTALEEMLQSLNQTLEHSLSPQSLQWRLEAKKTGKSFAEIILLRTLIYRVEQVFLIHRNTGLLLQHLIAPQVTTQDPDLVSAMLTAIQDFVRDSFSVGTEDGLQSLQFGELTIWIEEGPQAVLAAIIRGKPPQEFRLTLKDALEKIHLRLSSEMNDFVGDTEPFITSKPYLEACLAEGYKLPLKRNYTYAWGFLSTIAIACGIWGFVTIREQFRWHSYVQKLESQPGIVVVNTEQRQGKHFISGMRDPLAVDPKKLIQQANINPKSVIAQWQPYISLDPQLITLRSEKLLQPPKTVTLKVDENGILNATGAAPRQWISQAKNLWRFIPGVTQFNDNNLQDIALVQLNSYKQQLEQEMLFFSEGTTELIAGEVNKLPNLAIKINQLLDIAQSLNKNVSLQISGHTSTTGTEQINNLLSQARANKILAELTAQGINPSQLKTEGLGDTALPSQPELAPAGNRRVTFRVLITDTSKLKQLQ